MSLSRSIIKSETVRDDPVNECGSFILLRLGLLLLLGGLMRFGLRLLLLRKVLARFRRLR